MSVATTLPLWLATPALLFMLIVPGFVTLHFVLSFGKEKSRQPSAISYQYLSAGEQAFWTLALSVFGIGWLALLLAELGIFSIGLLLVVLGSWAFVAGSWLWRQGYRGAWWRAQLSFWRPRWGRTYLDGWVLTLLILGTTALFYFAPHETIVGAQDSGVYTNTGANIARTGAIVINDPLLRIVGEAASDPAIGPKVTQQLLPGIARAVYGKEDRFLFVKHLRLSGFFVRDNYEGLQTGEVVPQFFHLYPAYLSVGYGLFGVRGLLTVTPLFGVLGVWAVYLVAWRLFTRRRWVAPFAALFLALNGIQVWFARQSLWEMLGQFLIFTGIYAFILLLRPTPIEARQEENRENNPNSSSLIPHPSSLSLLGGLGAGLAFGLVCLAHAQFPFLVWPLVPYLIWTRLTRRWEAAHWCMLIAGGLLFLHTVLHIRIFSLGYFEGIYHETIANDLRPRLPLLAVLGGIAFFGAVLLDAMPQRLWAFENWLKKYWRFIAGGLALVVVGYLLYNYFIRVYGISTDGQGNEPPRYWSWQSYIGAPTTKGPERGLLRLGWYFSPPAMLLIFAGVGWLIARRLNSRTAFLLVLAGGVTVLFLDTSYTQEQYIYSLRRYVVLTVPAFALMLSCALFEALPAALNGLNQTISRLRGRRVLMARTAGGGSNLAFAIMQPLEQAPLATNNEGSVTTVSRASRWNWLLGLLLALPILLFLVWTNRTIFTLSHYGSGDGQPGLVAQVEALAARFGPKDVLLFAGDRDPDNKIGTPLTYIYGRPAFSLIDAVKNDELAGLIGRWEAQGYHVKALLGPNGGRFAPPGYELKLEGNASIKLRQLEELDVQKPYNIQLNSLEYAIYDVRRVGTTAEFSGSAGTGQVNTPGGWNLKIGQNDYASLISGFYGIEKDSDGTPYRWTQQHGVLRVPCLVPEGVGGKLSLTLSAGMRPAAQANIPVWIYLSNYRYSEDTKKWLVLGPVQLGPQPRTYIFDLPPNSPPLSCAEAETGGPVNSLILRVRNEDGKVFVPTSTGNSPDPRQLSFKLYGINVTTIAVPHN